jgi:Tol biopolymer transport system component
MWMLGAMKRLALFAPMLLAALTALLVAGAVSGAPTSQAAFPGRNGMLAFASNRSPLLHGEVYAVDIRTGRRSNVSRNWATESRPLLSPDGRKLAFLGDDGIYALDLGTRQRRRLVRIRGIARPLVRELAWSPDGRRIGYVPTADDAAPRRIFVVAARSGRPVSAGPCASSEGSCFAWAPDGQQLAVVRNERDLYVIRVGRRAARRIGRDARFPSWSPDGRWIAYSSRRLMLVRASGGRPRQIWSRGGPSTWAPDSKALAVNAAGIVFRLSPGRGRARRLGALGGENTGLMWSPRGRWIATATSGRFVELLSTTGRGRRRLRVSTGQTEAGSPSWSPDGAKLYYGASIDRMEAPYRVYIVRADGTRLRRVVAEPGTDPHWSPDGTRIAYQCGSSLCTVRPTGAGRKRLIGGVEGGGLSWSPDGTAVAFVRKGNVHVVNIDGSGLRRLTETPGTDDDSAFDPAWSPDGRSVAYTHHERFSEYDRFNPCCNETLTLIGADGGTPRALKVNYPVAYYPQPAWSPDGTRIAFVDQEGEDFCEEGPDGTECPPSHLFVLTLASGAIASVGPLDRAHQLNPAWSPDGTHLAYANFADIAVVRRDGSGRRRLLGAAARQGDEESPDWQSRCTLYGTARADRLRGTARRDVICGLGGNDVIEALAGADVVIGGDGNDRIDGGAGADRLFGAFGADTIQAKDGETDVVDGGPGRDTASADPQDASRLVP